MSETIAWIECRIYDKNHFTARYLAHLADLSGMQPVTIAKILCGLLFTILTLTDQAHFFANSTLIGIPLLLIFVYPDEKPSDESFFIYFPIFGGITLFDRSLEGIPCYYVLKLLFLLFFFMPPYTVCQIIANGLFIEKDVENSNKSRRDSIAKSHSMRTAIYEGPSPKCDVATDTTQITFTPSPLPIPSEPKSSDIKVTVIEEYYKEEELLSPNGSVIDRVITGPFRKETTRTERKNQK